MYITYMKHIKTIDSIDSIDHTHIYVHIYLYNIHIYYRGLGAFCNGHVCVFRLPLDFGKSPPSTPGFFFAMAWWT